MATILLLISSSIALAYAEDSPTTEPEGSSVSAPPSEPAGPELKAERTATSQTFELPDGSHETRIYQAPINYRNAEGDWKPIGADLEAADSGGVTNGANAFDVTLPAQMGTAPVRLSADGGWVSSRLLGAATDAVQLDGAEASYEGASSDTEFNFLGLPNGLKEDIEIAGPQEPSTFHFRLDASSGVSPTQADDGAVEFRDEGGQLVATLPAPVISDASSAMSPLSNPVSYSLVPKDGWWLLTVDADRDWLSQPDRSWPVTIDPTIIVPSPELDCDIYNGSKNLTNTCGSSGWQWIGAQAVSKPSGEDEYARSLLSFNLSSIPAKAFVTASEVGFYSPLPASNTQGVELRRVTNEWNNQVSWLKGKSTWVTQGGDYNLEGAVIKTSERGNQAGNWNFKSASLTKIVNGWISGTMTNNGLLIKLIDEAAHECSPSCKNRLVAFNSSASSPKPYLSVTYVPHASPDSKITQPKEGTHSAKRFKLAAAWAHQGVTGVTFQYQSSKDGWIDVPATKVTDQKGQTVKWPLPITGGAQQTEQFYWNVPEKEFPITNIKIPVRAVLVGAEGAAGYTEPVVVELNLNTGGPKDATTGVGPGTVDLLTGNFTVSRADVAIPGFSSLQFSRTHSSRNATAEEKGVLGPGWVPGSPVEEAGGAAWRSVRDVTETIFYEDEEVEESYTYTYAVLTGLDGDEYGFLKEPNGAYITPPEASGWSLGSQGPNQLVLTEPSGSRTVFDNSGAGNEYLPVSVSRPGGPGNKSLMVYALVNGNRQLSKVIAPAAEGVNCSESGATTMVGCHVLGFTYKDATTWGGAASLGKRLASITYYAATSPTTMGQWEVANYSYDSSGRLIAEWDPRVTPAPGKELKETYTYQASGQLATLTPPGQEPWTMQYATIAGDPFAGRLSNVKRASLVASPSVAQTTIAYGVPLSGSGVPDMSPSAVAKWGQSDLPTDATAIFPPDEMPASPPTSYGHATLYYMDAEGQLSNTATPAGAGTTAASIQTSEADEFGNVTRELSAQNRLRAIAAGAGSITKSHELETKRLFSPDGTELLEEWGPLHQVRLESGTSTQARLHKIVQYGNPSPPAGEAAYHLPTRETIGASIPGNGVDADQQVTVYNYNYALRKRTETIVDPNAGNPSGLNIVSKTVYDGASGLPIERRQPSDLTGTTAGTTKVIYYEPTSPLEECKSSQYANLPCKILPAAQPAPGQPKLLVKKFASYSPLGAPTEVIESPDGEASNQRKTIKVYDNAGRPLTLKIENGGVAVPISETKYSDTMGIPIVQQFKCTSSCTGFDTQATTATYDTLGRMTNYEDADGGKSKISYDLNGRPVVVADGKGTQTMTYDAASGLLTKLEDSEAGILTAVYDADGNAVERTLPNGLTAKTNFNELDEPTSLNYTKVSSCGASCTWFTETLERSVYGQILASSSSLMNNIYSYDKAGRVLTAAETPTSGQCTTRTYKYDKDSNREALTTRSAGVGGACSWSGGSTEAYSYDKADRLLGTGLVYDNFGRITSLPAGYAGGKALSTSYFSNDMVAVQSQGGVSNTFTLDAGFRQSQRLQAGGLEGTEVFHYSGPEDSPAWTQRGSAWTRSIAGIGGELAAIQDSSTGVVFQLSNLHGDIVATASPSSTATKLLSTARFDEFGNPTAGPASRFGWLGGKQRRSEFSSGIVQMGARSYVPSIGRFISLDAVAGGSANPYDYANADPVNGLDLSGTCPKKKCNLSNLKAVAPPNRPSVGSWTVAAPAPSSSAGGGGATVSVTGGITCAATGGLTDIRGFSPLGGEPIHAVTMTFTWSCNAKVTVYAWLKTNLGPSPPQPYGNAKTGASVIEGVPYFGYAYKPVFLCLKYFYAGSGTKDCSIATTVSER